MSNESELIANQRDVQSSPSPMPIEIPKHQVLWWNDIAESYTTTFRIIGKALQETRQSYGSGYDDEDEDFKWFTSGQANLSNFKGQYVAIWKKQIVSASSSVEAERIAKDTWGENISPLVTYIPKDEITVQE